MYLIHITIIIATLLLMYALSEIIFSLVIMFSKHMGVSITFISLTLVAFASSIPEISVSYTAGIYDNSDIAFGNILGSNIFNYLFPIAALVLFLGNIRNTFNKGLIFLHAYLLFINCVLFLLVVGFVPPYFTYIFPFLCLLFFGIYYRKYSSPSALEAHDTHNIVVVIVTRVISYLRMKSDAVICTLLTLFFLVGFALILYVSKIFIYHALELCSIWNLSDAFVGKTLIALGTCMPEITTALVAIKNKHHEFVVGDILGSNMINMSFGIPVFLMHGHYQYSSEITTFMTFTLIYAMVWFATYAFCRVYDKKIAFLYIFLYGLFISS